MKGTVVVLSGFPRDKQIRCREALLAEGFSESGEGFFSTTATPHFAAVILESAGADGIIQNPGPIDPDPSLGFW